MRVETRGARGFRAQLHQSEPEPDSCSSWMISMDMVLRVVGEFKVIERAGGSRSGNGLRSLFPMR